MKPLKQAHTSLMKKGVGTFTGQGKKQPVGKLRSGFITDKPQSINTKKLPKSLA